MHVSLLKPIMRLPKFWAYAFLMCCLLFSVQARENINALEYEKLLLQSGDVDISGTVTDENGEALPGATVIEKGTTNGTITDLDGNFKLTVGENAALSISFVGYNSSEISVAGQTVFNVKLDLNHQQLDEVVVVGYGTTKRENLTGSVASINLTELKDIPATSALQSIAGRMAGVNITVTEGAPDAEIKVRVRGGGSITQDNSPLYIVDGFRVNSISDIPPADIKSIDVLKDAASTAIYGAQGANGVVLITTKSGKIGKTEISFNTYTGVKHVYNLTDVLDPYEYVYYQKELDPGASTTSTSFYSMYGLWEDVDLYKNAPGTDWQDELYGNQGVQKHYDVGLSGGDNALRYIVNFTHDDEDFIMINSTYKRNNLSLKLNKEVSDNFTIDFYSRLSNTVITGPSISDGKKLRDGVKYAPVPSLSYVPVAERAGVDDITSAEALSALNDPIYNISNEYKKQDRFNNLYNLGLSWEAIEGLTLSTKGTYGFENEFTDNIWLRNTGEASANGGQPVARRTDKKGNRWSVQNTATYHFDLVDKMHDIEVLVGQEVFSSQKDEMVNESKFYPGDFSAKDVLSKWNYGTPLPTYTSIGEPDRTSSFFGRVNYILADKYVVTATTRVDGKNVFAPGNRWGVFPGVALAWKLDKEAFMTGTSDWLSSAKVRASYGEVGNARVDSYWRQQYNFQDGDNKLIYIDETAQSSLQPTTVLKNEDLTWETKITQNVGVDLGFFNQMVTVTVDVYNDITKDLILGVALPSNSGYDVQYQNVGSTSNRGLEFTTNAYLIDKKDFRLSANFNISFNRNTIEKLDGSDYLIASSGWGLSRGFDDYRAFVGEPLGQIYGYKSDGMYSFDDFTFNETTKRWEINDGVADASAVVSTSGGYFGPGHPKLKKLTEGDDMVITTDDRTVIGNAQPKHTGGFSLNGFFKGFDFSAMFNWSYGNDIYNANKIDYTTFTGSKRYQNLSSSMSLSKRFTTIDPETGYNIMYGTYADPARLQELNQNASIWHPITNSSILTDWAVEDGSFLRLNTLTFGYTLPAQLSKRALMEKLRVYVTAYNLKCWTNYSGQDPEVDTRRSTPLTPGVDYSAYPKAKTYLVGLNVTF